MSDFLTVDAATSKIKGFISEIHETEVLPIRSALDRVLAEDILSPISVPASDNSAMDGYAFAGQQLSFGDKLKLKIKGTVLAGSPHEGRVQEGECVRIMTGAVMPPGCDTVVIQESVDSSDDETICFETRGLKPGDNRRLAGEDLSKGKPALLKGKILSPADLGLIASLGIPEVKVKRRLRVAFFSTGDELRSLGQTLDPGCVFDSNRYTLFGMLTRLRFVEVIDLGVVKDNPQALEHTMQEAAELADVVLTSGGVSVGEADYTKDVMQKLGKVDFWKIAMRPGRPMAFGPLRKQAGAGSALLFGLPGNPVAVMVTFYAFVRQALFELAGAQAMQLPTVTACLSTPVRKKPGRTEYQRVRLELGTAGWLAHITGSQGSGILRSMSESDGLLVLDHDSGSLEKGAMVQVLPYYGLA